MNKYRIIKRKNSVFKDQDEFVVQQEVYNYHRPINMLGVTESPTYWTNLGKFATLEAAKANIQKLEAGLNPGETIVG